MYDRARYNVIQESLRVIKKICKAFKNLKNISINKPTVKTVWTISYILLIFVPTLIFSSVLVRYISIIENTVNESYDRSLEMIAAKSDEVLERAEICVAQCAENNSLQQLYEKNMSVDTEQNNVYRLSIHLKNLDMISGMDSIVMRYDDDSVISKYGLYDFNFYAQTYLGVNGTYADNLNNELKLITDKTYVPLNSKSFGTQKNGILLVIPYKRVGMYQRGVIMQFIPQSVFENFCNEMRFLNGGELMCIDGNGNVIMSTVSDDNRYGFIDNFDFDKYGFDGSFTRGKSSFWFRMSGKTMLKYILAIPSDAIRESSDRAKKNMFAGILFTFACGSIMTYILLKKNYKPIASIIESIGSSGAKNENEFKYIEDNLKLIFDRNNKQSVLLEKYRAIEKNDVIKGLINGSAENVRLRLEECDISFEYNNFCIILFCRSNSDAPSSRLKYDKYANYAMKNIIEYLFGENNDCFVIDADTGVIALLLNFEKLSEYRNYQSLCEKAINVISDEFKTTFFAVIGSVYNDVNESFDNYCKIKQRTNSMQYYCNDEVFELDKLSSKNSGGNISVITNDELGKLKALIEAGDVSVANEWAENYFKKLQCRKNDVSKRYIQCAMFDMTGTIIKIAASFESMCGKKILPEDAINRLINCDHIGNYLAELKNIINGMCTAVSPGGAEMDKTSKLVDEIKEYVGNNYTDVNFSILSVEEKFGMSGYYLSGMFKQKTGEKLLDYVNRVRIDASKKLLRDSGMTLDEIAEKCGFTSATVYIRTFKKYENITPRKYVL
mgnify:FL=1